MYKICTRCKEEKYITEFRKAKDYKDNIHSWCVACERVWHKENKPKPRAIIVTHQVCSICKVNQEADKFSRCKTRVSGLDKRCKQCYRDITRERRGGLNQKTIEKRKLQVENKFRCGLCSEILDLNQKTSDDC